MSFRSPDEWLKLERRVRFGDTDAAGVMHFHQLLRLCHEAWEDSLERYGIAAADVFPGCRAADDPPTIALPVVHCAADFSRPIHGGDHLVVTLKPTIVDPSQYEVRFLFQLEGADVAQWIIRQLAINSETRRRCALPEAIDRWLEASAIGTVGSL